MFHRILLIATLIALLPACNGSNDSTPKVPDQFEVGISVVSGKGELTKKNEQNENLVTLDDYIQLSVTDFSQVQVIEADSKCYTIYGAFEKSFRIKNPTSKKLQIVNFVPVEVFKPTALAHHRTPKSCVISLVVKNKIGSSRYLDDLPIKIKEVVMYSNFNPLEVDESHYADHVFLEKVKKKEFVNNFSKGQTHLLCHNINDQGVVVGMVGKPITLQDFPTKDLFLDRASRLCRIVAMNGDETQTKVSKHFYLQTEIKLAEIQWYHGYSTLPAKTVGSLRITNPNRFEIMVWVKNIENTTVNLLPVFGSTKDKTVYGYGPNGTVKVEWKLDKDSVKFQNLDVDKYEFFLPAFASVEFSSDFNLCNYGGDMSLPKNPWKYCLNSNNYDTFFKGYYFKFENFPKVTQWRIPIRTGRGHLGDSSKYKVDLDVYMSKNDLKNGYASYAEAMRFDCNHGGTKDNQYYQTSELLRLATLPDTWNGPEAARQEYNCSVGSIGDATP